MEYRVLETHELGEAQDLIETSGYYKPVELSEIGGIVLGAWHHGKLVASLWLALTGRRAYLDYLVVDPAHKGIGLRLLVVGKKLLQGAGVREVQFLIHAENKEAARLAEVFAARIDGPYAFGSATL